MQNPVAKQDFRADRYRVQNVIRKLFLADSAYDSFEPDYSLYNSLPRVVKCRRCRTAPNVTIKLDRAANRAHYSGLVACGSVWTCPVCASQVQEARRLEIAAGLDWAYTNGKKAVMVTFTTPHYSFQSCADLLDKFAQAHKYFRSGKSWSTFKNTIGFEGCIRSLETLYGSNGWHTHTHELLIVDAAASALEIKDYISNRWESACNKFNLIPRGKIRDFRRHAIHVVDYASNSDYLAKSADIGRVCWGADRELTKAFSKTSRNSYHPFQLADIAGSGDKKAAGLFLEYAEAFKGRAAIYWSPGLKSKCSIANLSDQELSETIVESAVDIAIIDFNAWAQVLRESARVELLQLAEVSGESGVLHWLKSRQLNVVPLYHSVALSELRTMRRDIVIDKPLQGSGYFCKSPILT